MEIESQSLNVLWGLGKAVIILAVLAGLYWWALRPGIKWTVAEFSDTFSKRTLKWSDAAITAALAVATIAMVAGVLRSGGERLTLRQPEHVEPAWAPSETRSFERTDAPLDVDRFERKLRRE